MRRKWLSLGHTILFGEYGRYIDQLSPAALAAGATGSEFGRFGLGAVQEIDAASISVWMKYREQAPICQVWPWTSTNSATFRLAR